MLFSLEKKNLGGLFVTVICFYSSFKENGHLGQGS